MHKLFLLGGNILNSGFADIAKKFDADLVVIDWNKTVSWVEQHIQADIKGTELLCSLDYSDVLCAYTSADVASYNVAEINQRAGLMAPSVEMIDNCVFKHKAYICFASNNLLGREYKFIDYDYFAATVSKFYATTNSFVVKPTNSASSRGVSILHNPTLSELQNVVGKTLAEFPAGVLLDKFIAGTEYSIEMLVDAYGNVKVWPIGLKCKSIHKTSEAVSVKVIYNPFLSEKFENDLVDFSIQCAKSTGVRSSFLHFEVKCDNNKFYPVEIACRSTGFVASHLCDLVSQDSYFGSYINVLRGSVIKNGLVDKIDRSSVYFFYDFPPGEVTDLPDEEQVFNNGRLKTLYSNLPVLSLGQNIANHVNDDTKKCFRVMLADRYAELQQDLESMESEYYAKTIYGVECV